jgi:DNA-binding SARP family transcriptional activator
MAARIIHLLGKPTTDAGPVRGHKPWAITAYLALSGSPVSRERLIALLFEDAEDPSAALRWNLAQVRHLLGCPEALQGSVLHLPRDATLRLDVDILASGRWQDIVALPDLGHELLEGMQFSGCPSFQTWLLGERRRLGAVTEAALQEAALTLLSTGDLSAAVRFATRLVARNPLDDGYQELLIRAYATSGDTAAARRQLESAVRLFQRELACAPAASVFLAAELAPIKTSGPATPARVRALLEAGTAQMAAGAVDAAVQLLRTACDEAARLGDPRQQATAQLALGGTLIGAGRARHQAGELALQRAISLAQESGDPSIAASAYRQLAASDVFRGIYPRANRRLDAAARLDASEPLEIAAIRGTSLLDQGDVRDAIDTFEGGLATDPGRTHRFLPIMLSHLGRAHLLAEDLGAARCHLREALSIAETRAWAGVTAAPLALLGHAAVRAGELDSAHELLEDALARASQIADPCWETWAAHGLALHSAARGDRSAAVDHAADAIHRSRPERGGHLWSHVWALTDGRALASSLGDRRAALWADEALATALRCGMRGLAARLAEDAVRRPG